jgi:hypothetical protein
MLSKWKNIGTCPSCKILWNVRYIFDIDGNIVTERENFIQTSIKENNILTTLAKCDKCNKKFIKKTKINNTIEDVMNDIDSKMKEINKDEEVFFKKHLEKEKNE